MGIKPKVIGEFEDSALLSTFGRDGVGAFAISMERRLKHPATVAITTSARADLFGR